MYYRDKWAKSIYIWPTLQLEAYEKPFSLYLLHILDINIK